MAMAVETRPELVGKRFLCVSGDEPLDLGDIGRWGWRAGVIRAVTHRDNNNSELTIAKPGSGLLSGGRAGVEPGFRAPVRRPSRGSRVSD
eukprot:XP_014039831.1 PREDICTED: probable JmjC domain-containing histone demethylation protein 2C [Salmo salar]